MHAPSPPAESSSSSTEETCGVCCVPLYNNSGICDECQEQVAIGMSHVEFRIGQQVNTRGNLFSTITEQANKSTRSPSRSVGQHTNTITPSGQEQPSISRVPIIENDPRYLIRQLDSIVQVSNSMSRSAKRRSFDATHRIEETIISEGRSMSSSIEELQIHSLFKETPLYRSLSTIQRYFNSPLITCDTFNRRIYVV